MIAPPAASSACPDTFGSAAPPLGPAAVLMLSGWCGLTAGLLEVATLVARKSWFDANRFYGMSRHFVWLVPLIDLGLFLVLGVLLAILIRFRPARGAWLSARLLVAMTVLPAAMVALPMIYGPAWLLVMLGIAARVVPAMERHAAGVRRALRLSAPIAVGALVALAGWTWAADRSRAAGPPSRATPRADAPNILLVVLDAVAAGHLDLHGYARPTSPTLDELARQGIRFDAARAASSWTLPSHASMFTGRWPHELSAGWLTPLDRSHTTIAEYLGSRGYDTGGFIANTHYCATDSGLSRGFATYRDYIFPRLTALKPAVLVDRAVEGLFAVEQGLRDWFGVESPWPVAQRLWFDINLDRKDAATVHGEFLAWVSSRRPADRPFFAFLNDYDAHWPYQVPELGIHRFGTAPRDADESALIQDWWKLDRRTITPAQVAFARDAYDDCVAHLDEQVGRLIDELSRRGLRERTWVIVLADHGESFGEHPGLYSHGSSLYRTELHVPLVILPPASRTDLAGLRIARTVSLRDIAATIADLAGEDAEAPFPGESLARCWDRPSGDEVGRPPADGVLSEVVPDDQVNPAPSPEARWPLAALSDGDWTYIRREGAIVEELHRLADDPLESRNLAGDPAARPTLERMRAALGRLTAGPLTPSRFRP